MTAAELDEYEARYNAQCRSTASTAPVEIMRLREVITALIAAMDAVAVEPTSCGERTYCIFCGDTSRREIDHETDCPLRVGKEAMKL